MAVVVFVVKAKLLNRNCPDLKRKLQVHLYIYTQAHGCDETELVTVELPYAVHHRARCPTLARAKNLLAAALVDCCCRICFRERFS